MITERRMLIVKGSKLLEQLVTAFSQPANLRIETSEASE